MKDSQQQDYIAKKSSAKNPVAKVFAYDGRFMELLTGFGELTMLSAVFIVCCLPIITIGPAVTSLYYAVIKSVRRGRGTPVHEFFASMKRILGKGILITVGIIAVAAAMYIGYRQAGMMVQTAQDTGGSGQTGKIFSTIYVVLFTLLMLIAVYIFPILSRFTMGITDMIKLSFVMGLRYIPVTVAVIAGTALLGWLQIYVLPMPCILFVPGCWCYIVTFMMEKVLLHYMPKPGEGEDAWYYNNGGKG